MTAMTALLCLLGGIALMLAGLWKTVQTGRNFPLILGFIAGAFLLLVGFQSLNKARTLEGWIQNPGSLKEQIEVVRRDALPQAQREAVGELAEIDKLNSETYRNYSEVELHEYQRRMLQEQTRQIELDNVSTIGGALGITWHTLSQSSLAPCLGLLFLLTLVGAAFAGAFFWARLAGG